MKKIQKVAFVGSFYPHYIKWLDGAGYELYHFYDIGESAEHHGCFKKAWAVDFSSEEKLSGDLKKIDFAPDCILDCKDNSVVMRAMLCKYYNLPGPSIQSAFAATDKHLMREAFAKSCPEYSPRFTEVRSWQDIENFVILPNICFPLILKPTNLSKSLLVSRNNSLEELKKSYDIAVRTIADIYDREKVKRAPSFVVEECLIGKACSVEVFCDRDGNAQAVPWIVDLTMAVDLGINDNFNYSRKLPTTFSKQEQKKIIKAAVAGVKALGLTSTQAHVEIFYTKQGPKIIEIGPREGGFRRKMHFLSSGEDLFEAKMDVAMGKLPVFASETNKYVAVYELFPTREGILDSIKNLDQLKKLSSFVDIEMKRQVDEKIGLSSQGFRAVAVITLATANKGIFEKDTKWLENEVKVVTK